MLGTGRVGGALGPRLAEIGMTVRYGSRDPHSDTVSGLLAQSPSATAHETAEAAAEADWVLLAVPYSALTPVLGSLGDLQDKLVIDVTNALGVADDGQMRVISEQSAAEEIQAAKPNAKVVKAFNTVGFHIMANPELAGGPVSVPLASDHDAEKQCVAELVTELSLHPVDVGPLRMARSLEAMAAIYLVPYLSGRRDEAFEFYFRSANAPKNSKGVRAAE